VPAAIGASLLGVAPPVVFLLSLVAILPVAKLMGDGTEALAAVLGPHKGGLLNATLGNAAELIITLVALQAGLLQLVLASITGSIIGNLLLICGLSFLLGGLRHGIQHFDRRLGGMEAAQMVLAIIALGIPTMVDVSLRDHRAAEVLLSDMVAIVMLVLYGLGVVYALSGSHGRAPEVHAHAGAAWSRRTALSVLAIATATVVVLSEIMVGAVEPTMEAWGVSEFFIGIILVPIVGNAAEHLVAVSAARDNRMDLSVAISLGSSTQIALLVAPVLVLASRVIAPEAMVLVFHPFELAALVAATAIGALIALDGESNWMEGAQLIAVYVILAVAFFFVPSI
jgi:Ca2+:H+ antiporter